MSSSLAKIKVDQYYVENQNSFKGVQYVETLPVKKQLRGEITTVEEIPSVGDYYDGTMKFSSVTVSCNQWTTQREVCLNQKSCGWCGSSNSCIPGNNLGPLAPCLRGRYTFSEPSANWNPFDTKNVSISRRNVGGAQLTTIAPN